MARRGLYRNESINIDGPFRAVDEFELATLSWVDWFIHRWLHSSVATSSRSRPSRSTTVVTPPRQQPLPGELALQRTRGDSFRGMAQ
jgi:putative transposase